MASEKKRPPEKDYLVLPHEKAGIEDEKTIPPQNFSTHPPPHRETISGSFRLNMPEDESSIARIYMFFSKLRNFDTDILKPAIGGIFLKEFDLFERLPYRVRDSITHPLLQFIKAKSIPYVNDDGEDRYQLPRPEQVNREIIRQVFEKKRIQIVQNEVEQLTEHNHSDDITRAEELLDATIQWMENYEVQLFAHAAGINTSTTITELRSRFFRLKTRRVLKNTQISDPDSPPSESQQSSKKEGPDRS